MTTPASLDHPSPPSVAPADQQIRVVLFSGGSGTKSISEQLAGHSQIALTILINCYDDGHSTGRLRRFIPGMLGPSDVRKNIGRLMPQTDRCYHALQYVSDHRLPVGVSAPDAQQILQAIANQHYAALPPSLQSHYEQLSVRQAIGLAGYCSAFLKYASERAAENHFFDFTDCALGNIYFAGCFLLSGRDFNRTIDAFARFYEVGAQLLNITRGENLFLIAEKDDGTYFLSEADLVSSPAKIRRISLVEESIYHTRIENYQGPATALPRLLASAEQIPQINPLAATALREADVIIYGPGTQHSSLLPSYFTCGVGPAIAANRSADKIFVTNTRRDVDIQTDDVNDIATKFLEAVNREGVPVAWRDCITHFFVQQPVASDSSYIPFDGGTFPFPLETVIVRDWEASEGKHHGGYVFDEVQQIVQSRIQISLAPRPSLISIIVPALNEARTIESVLKQLIALDFDRFGGLGKEVILIDGGSTDGTLEIARKQRGVKVLQSPRPGRGAALRHGINESRGNLIIFFPADREYRAEDLYTIAGHLASRAYKAVFGTRTTKVMDLSEHLHRIYAGHRFLYLMSKYGGLLISIATLVLYNRYISDTLTSVKGFDGRTLRNLSLTCDGVDLDAEIVAKLCREKHYILEVPVDFTPRTRDEGKKTGVLDGLGTLVALVRYRFGA